MGKRTVLLLNGPNLDLLGTREPALYGSMTLDGIVARVAVVAEAAGVSLRHRQESGEGAMVQAVHGAAADGLAGAVVNAAGYTHTSVVLRDAFLATGLPFVEVHLTNVMRREAFRHQSLLSDIAIGVITGFGPIGYELALTALIHHLRSTVHAG